MTLADRQLALELRLARKFGLAVKVANDETTYTVATGKAGGAVSAHREPGVATVLGELAAATPPFGAPGGSHGDAFLAREGSVLALYMTTNNFAQGGAGVVRIEKPYSSTDLLTGWGSVALASGRPDLLWAPTSGSSAEARDTASVLYHPVLKKTLGYHSARPGTRPAGATNVGTIDTVQVAETPGVASAASVWTLDNVDLLTVAQIAYASAISQVEGELTVHRGAVNETTPVWDEELQTVVLLVSVIEEDSPGGQWAWHLARAVDAAGTGRGFVIDGDERFTPNVHIQSGWGAGVRGAHHYHGLADPRDGTYHVVFKNSANNAVGHIYSLDKGQTWIENAANPILTTTAINAVLGAEAVGVIGAPFLYLDETAGANGKLFVGCDGAASQRYVNSKIILAEIERPADPWADAWMQLDPGDNQSFSSGSSTVQQVRGWVAASGLPITLRNGSLVKYQGRVWRVMECEPNYVQGTVTTYRVDLRR